MNDQDKLLTRADKQDILDHITQERRNADNHVNREVGKVNRRLERVEDRLDNVENRLERIENRLEIEPTQKTRRKTA